jgi:hypothetical protein
VTILGFRHTELALRCDLDMRTHSPLLNQHAIIQTVHLAMSTAVFARRAMDCQERQVHY